MGGSNEVSAVTPGYGQGPPSVACISFKHGTRLPATLLSEESATTPADRMGIGARPPLQRAINSSTESTESLPTRCKGYVLLCMPHPPGLHQFRRLAYLWRNIRTHKALQVPGCQNDSEDGVVGCMAFTNVGFHIDLSFRATG